MARFRVIACLKNQTKSPQQNINRKEINKFSPWGSLNHHDYEHEVLTSQYASGIKFYLPWKLFSQSSKQIIHQISRYLLKIPSTESCWINFMLEILTFIPMQSTKVSPLPLFSMTMSSGRPYPKEESKTLKKS